MSAPSPDAHPVTLMMPEDRPPSTPMRGGAAGATLGGREKRRDGGPMAGDALKAARQRASGIDPAAAARACGARWDGSASAGTLVLPFLGQEVRLTWPAFELAEGSAFVPDHVLALLVYHFALSDGTEPTGRMVSFAELPDGGFYVQAFRGYTGAAIARRFGAAPDALDAAARSLGGRSLESAADRAWRIPALPRLPVYLQFWAGDDEFEPRAELLFDETAPHHLMIDGFAVLGSWLTAMLSRSASAAAR